MLKQVIVKKIKFSMLPLSWRLKVAGYEWKGYPNWNEAFWVQAFIERYGTRFLDTRASQVLASALCIYFPTPLTIT